MGEGETIEVNQSAGLGSIPLFVKDGGIIPMNPPTLHSPTQDETRPLTVRYYGTQPGRFMLYDDDGTSFDFERGQYGWTPLEVTIREGKPEGKQDSTQGKAPHYGPVQWEYMTR